LQPLLAYASGCKSDDFGLRWFESNHPIFLSESGLPRFSCFQNIYQLRKFERELQGAQKISLPFEDSYSKSSRSSMGSGYNVYSFALWVWVSFCNYGLV